MARAIIQNKGKSTEQAIIHSKEKVMKTANICSRANALHTIKRLFAALAVLAVFFAAPLGRVWAQGEEPISSSFTSANVLPDVTALEVYSDSELTTVANSLTPQVTYYVQVTAGDVNTIDDIDEVEVHLFYDSAGTDPSTPDVANTQSCAILLWDKDGGGSEWTVSAGSPTTWAIVGGSSVVPSDMSASSDDWVFVVTVGKVASESPGADDWDVYAAATDGGGSDTLYTRDKEMLWYGEIATSATAPFGSVALDSGFADDTNEVGSLSVTYTSNGDYDQKAKSDATWTGSLNDATYDATGACSSAQEFSLKAYPSDTFGSAVQVDTSGVSVDATGTQTGETGNAVASNTLWLKVASIFTTDTYSGNVTYIVADR